MQISGVCTLRDFDMAGHPEMTLQGQIPSCYQTIFPQSQNTEKNVLEILFANLSHFIID